MVMRGTQSYMQSGVMISPTNPSVGDRIKLTYDGLLAKSGASAVYAHIGYGNKFENVTDIPMSRSTTGFEVTFPVLKADTINVCFKDSANNWDNNSGKNYTFEVQ